MVYLEYLEPNKMVIRIHETEPETDNPVAKTDQYKVGDEVEFMIFVNEVDSKGNAISLAGIRQSPSVQYLLQEIRSRDERIALLEQIQSEQDDILMDLLLK